MGHTLEVQTGFSKVGSKSTVNHQAIYIADSDKLAAAADITFVCLDQKTGKAVPIDGELKSRLELHLTE
ncbi:acyl-CoA thioesterase [Rheinheimera salexigens]|uniref:Thioesterase domain-containing protein n=1 Tax=Rheinheimera salexigens TaxID=1628148 RepID=A0A1E7Q257_9GAMM|nr:hypothetical protein [Rheinheimera salexigens]OEY68267.1 hypothetical protein BI198_00840 [Rheinheimera salexigens]